MLKLIIKTKGLFINIPGVPPFRTPAEIDITKLNLNIITSELKKNGIASWKIISGETEIIEPHPKKVKDTTSTTENIINIDKQDEVLDKLNKIEKRLNDFLNGDKFVLATVNNTINDNKQIKTKKVKEDEVDDFIPSINLNNLTLKGRKKVGTTIKEETNYQSSAENLKKYKK